VIAYLAAQDDGSAAVGIRLTIVISIWVLLSQLLRAMTARGDALTEALRASAHTDPLTGGEGTRARPRSGGASEVSRTPCQCFK
jgi:hypothetical protein